MTLQRERRCGINDVVVCIARASVSVHVRKFPRDKWRMIYSSHDRAQAAVQITHRVQKTFAVRDSNSYICINAGISPVRPARRVYRYSRSPLFRTVYRSRIWSNFNRLRKLLRTADPARMCRSILLSVSTLSMRAEYNASRSMSTV